MQLAIRRKDEPNGRIYIFKSASDCSYFLTRRPNYVAKALSIYYHNNRSFKGLELSNSRKEKFVLIACENRGFTFNEDFNFDGELYFRYGNEIILRNANTDLIYNFKNYSRCSIFLGRSTNYFSIFKEQRTFVTSLITNEKFFIVQFKLRVKDAKLDKVYKTERARVRKLHKEKDKHYKKVSKLLESINSKYADLVEASDEKAPEFLELQKLEGVERK